MAVTELSSVGVIKQLFVIAEVTATLCCRLSAW